MFLGKGEKQCHLTREEMAAKIEEIYNIQLDRNEKILLQLHFREILETMLMNIKALTQVPKARSKSPDAVELRQQLNMQFIGLIN